MAHITFSSSDAPKARMTLSPLGVGLLAVFAMSVAGWIGLFALLA